MSAAPLALRAAALLELRRRNPARARRMKGERPELGELRLNPLWPKQSVALETTATELLFGGAAGAGKSHLFRYAAIFFSLEIPGLQTYIFRRELPDLLKNHVYGPTGFLEMLAPWLADGFAKFNGSKNYISIGKSTIYLCHCQYEKDVYGYQGADIHLLMPDELTQFSDPMYRYLRGRCRVPEEFKAKMPERYRDLFPRVMAGTNPGNIGHNWVKAAFVDPAPPMEIWTTPRKEAGMRRQFIPGRLGDNPSLDPDEYALKLEGLAEHLKRAMLDGDWNIVAGGMFDDLWRSELHVMAPFAIPKSWRIDRSFDYGESKPFSVGWYAESDGCDVTLADGSRRSFYPGTVFQIAEWYGWNGKPNEGCRMTSAEIATGIKELEALWFPDGGVEPGPADSSIFDGEKGKTIADTMASKGITWTLADKSPGSRIAGADEIRRRLKAGLRIPMEDPGLFFFDKAPDGRVCRDDLIRTLPTLPRDQNKPDDADTKAEDHGFDRLRYRLMTPQHYSYFGSHGYG